MKLITRSDFDGLVCAVFLKEVVQLDEVEFAHPKDVQDGKVSVTADHILTNLPYVPGVGLWFDHHSSESGRMDDDLNFSGSYEIAPSAARVVYNFYKGKTDKLEKYKELLADVDKYDSAQLAKEDVLNPQGWILLAYIMDPRTGLGFHHDYAISNRQLMYKMIDLIQNYPVSEIVTDPDVKVRIDRYFSEQKKHEEFLRKNSRQISNVVITDLRGIKDILVGNRFSIYLMYPETNVSLRVFDGRNAEVVVVAGGYSIFNKTAKADLGELFSRYGGGGHKASGTCQLKPTETDQKVQEIIDAIVKQG